MGSGNGTVLLRGEGGAVQAYDLPLRPAFADAVAAGRLVTVDEDGNPIDSDVADAAGTPEPEDSDGRDGTPAKSAKVDDWRSYAITLGGDEDTVAAMTKAEVIAWVDNAAGTPEPEET